MRVLIIEDEDGVVKFLRKAFSAERYAVDAAFDGAAGVAFAEKNDYDLIILDINLPKKDGLEVCKEIRQKKGSLPILMLSSRSDTATKVDALNLGADDYLTKPFSFEELLARSRALLRRQRQLTGPVLAFEDLTLNAYSFEAARAGTALTLSKKEFALLEYFMRNAGTSLTRNMILEHVWDMNIDPFSNTVDMHVNSLRKKVDSGFERKLIHTVHGLGYKMA